MCVGVLCWRKGQFFLSRKMVLTCEQRIFIVKHFFRNKSYVLCQEAFPKDNMLNKTVMYRIILKYEEAMSVCDRRRNRRRTVLNDDRLEDMRLSLLFCCIVTIL
jgi:hypothetical protein